MRKALFGTAVCASLVLGSLARAEPQPKMREALGDLDRAIVALETAAHDKGGHRAKALELARAAREEVRAGIQFDNRH